MFIVELLWTKIDAFEYNAIKLLCPFTFFSNKLYACCSALLPHKLVLQHPIPGFSAKKILLSKKYV